jgi:putative nucleotidyltransferase with HDIG domain
MVFDQSSDQVIVVSSWQAGENGCQSCGEASVDAQAWLIELRETTQCWSSSHIEPTLTEGRADEHGITVMRVPLIAHGELLGAIEATLDSCVPSLSERQQAVVAALASIGAVALHNCEKFEIAETQWLILTETLCRTIHSRDAYKRDHAEHVSRIALELARAMGLTDLDRLQLVRVAALVHDIGKIGLPPQLFEKRGRLRAGERKMVEEHCAIGAQILEHIPHMNDLPRIVRHHHEHYDGSGYPDRLAGNEIPIESRILAVADTYDAMTSLRPYRSPLSHREAIKAIEAAAGSQFDPAVVAVFVEHFGSNYGQNLLGPSLAGTLPGLSTELRSDVESAIPRPLEPEVCTEESS